MTDGEIARRLLDIFDLRPYAIIRRFGLKKPIYAPTAAYGHMGRDPYRATVTLYDRDEKPYQEEVDFFAWEKLDYVEKIREAFGV
jgi:S-adenosylmethionine synthetase